MRRIGTGTPTSQASRYPAARPLRWTREAATVMMDFMGLSSGEGAGDGGDGRGKLQACHRLPGTAAQRIPAQSSFANRTCCRTSENRWRAHALCMVRRRTGRRMGDAALLGVTPAVLRGRVASPGAGRRRPPSPCLRTSVRWGCAAVRCPRGRSSPGATRRTSSRARRGFALTRMAARGGRRGRSTPPSAIENDLPASSGTGRTARGTRHGGGNPGLAWNVLLDRTMTG
jgi:hypothetical protein